jgi:hypothetical protein
MGGCPGLSAVEIPRSGLVQCRGFLGRCCGGSEPELRREVVRRNTELKID